VRSLLDQPDSAAGFLARPVQEVAARLVSGTSALLTGRRIGVFEVMERIGMGGMGEVYRARDTRLGRDVAVKVLPDAFAQDGERLARFNREAQALAALNHPNVAVIHGVEELPAASGQGPRSRALVMELVDGEDLSAHIARGPMPMAQALPIARQIARALEAAHERGIVHRDLKPANIKIRRDGTVKVLDFGLAKVLPLPTGEDQAGRIDSQVGEGAMGTPGYMSPEQIRGQKVDWRSDLFAFGVVLYEMLSGRRAFARASGAETMSATLTETLPDLHSAAPGTDPTLALAVARCLEKNPEDRFQSAKDLGFALETLSQPSGLRAVPIPWQRKWRTAGAVAALVAGLGMVAAALRPNSPPRPPTTYRQVTSDGHSLIGDLSPDGETLAYVSRDGDARRLMIRDIAGGPPVELYREKGLGSVRWSHSGREIAVSAENEVLVTSRFGGVPVRIGSGWANKISWTPDDRELILSSPGGRSFRVASLQTRKVRRVELAPSSPEGGLVTDLSSDGERLLMLVPQQPHEGVWSMSRDGTDLRQHVREKRRAYDARWADDGASFYYLITDGKLSEIRRARVLAAGPEMSPEVVQGNLTIQESSSAFIAVSPTGRLAYPRVSFDRNLWRADLSPALSADAPIPLRAVTIGTRNEYPRFSPDRTRVVFSSQDGELGQILIASAEGEIQKTVVSRHGLVEEPAWSPDGESVAYVLDDEENGRVLHVVRVSSGADRTIGPANGAADPEWAPGTDLIYLAPGWLPQIVDSISGSVTPLFSPEPGESHYSPRYSNRRDHIAMYLNAPAKGVAGLAIASLQGRSIRMIPGTGPFVRPIGWSADDEFVYAVEEETRRLLAVRSDGSGRRVMGSLPSLNTHGHAVEMGGELKLVFWYPNDRSDIWIVDNFDSGR
jgi:serine/threonine protein kinase